MRKDSLSLSTMHCGRSRILWFVKIFSHSEGSTKYKNPSSSRSLGIVTADISMLSLERNSVSPERYCSNSSLLSKSSFSSFVSFKTPQLKYVYYRNAKQRAVTCVQILEHLTCNFNRARVLLYVSLCQTRTILHFKRTTVVLCSLSMIYNMCFSKSPGTEIESIDLVTVFDAILTSRQTRKKLQ